MEEERKSKHFEEKEMQTDEPRGEEKLDYKANHHLELNAFQTYGELSIKVDLLNVQNLVNRLSQDNEVIHS